jgi:hypothetical protein
LIFVCLYHLFPSLIDASIVFQQDTLLRWHCRGFRLFWRWKSRRRVGRPANRIDELLPWNWAAQQPAAQAA